MAMFICSVALNSMLFENYAKTDVGLCSFNIIITI